MTIVSDQPAGGEGKYVSLRENSIYGCEIVVAMIY